MSDDDFLEPDDEGLDTDEHLSEDVGETVDSGDEPDGPIVPPHLIAPD